MKTLLLPLTSAALRPARENPPLKRGLFWMAAVAAAFILAPFSQAASLTWDNSGTNPTAPTDGFSSLWDTTAAVWSNAATDAAWVNANNDIAAFGSNNGAAGTVNLGSAITAGGITFNAATSGNYTIAGGTGPFTLTLAGATPTITTNVNAAISAVIAGSAGLTKSGAGLLTLSGSNTYTGGTVISAGTLSADVNANLGSSSSATDKNLTILNGGTFQWTGGASGFNRTFVLGAGTATIQVDTGDSLLANVTPSYTGSGARELVLTGTAGGTGTLGGLLADGTGGATSLTKNGAGLWTLNGANTYTGDTTINAGTLTVGTTVGAKIPTASTVRVNTGATLRIDNTSGQTIGNLQDGSGGGGTVAMNVTGTTALTVQSGSFSGVLKDQNAGTKVLALTKNTGGTLTLSGTNNTYTGGTIVSAGTLLINNASGNALGTGAVVVNTGTLGGVGFTSANITIGDGTGTADATIAPGNSSTGTFTTTGSLTMLSDADFKFELNSGTLAADKVVANGVTLNSSATFSFTDLGSGTITLGTTFTVIDNTSGSAITGAFSNLANGSQFTSGANTFQASYTGGTGNDLVLTAVVPEPSTLGLLSLGFTALWWRARHRRSILSLR
ncbi:MAG: autotransporter-associated beta strand repeat-containing protein [Terrimicrobiaceae bacterium]